MRLSSSKKPSWIRPRADARRHSSCGSARRARQRGAEVDVRSIVGRRVRRGDAHERRRDQRVAEEGQRERVDRARLAEAEPAADLHRLLLAAETARPPKRALQDRVARRSAAASGPAACPASTGCFGGGHDGRPQVGRSPARSTAPRTPPARARSASRPAPCAPRASSASARRARAPCGSLTGPGSGARV